MKDAIEMNEGGGGGKGSDSAIVAPEKKRKENHVTCHHRDRAGRPIGLRHDATC